MSSSRTRTAIISGADASGAGAAAAVSLIFGAYMDETAANASPLGDSISPAPSCTSIEKADVAIALLVFGVDVVIFFFTKHELVLVLVYRKGLDVHSFSLR